jgi:hypothetical protein
VTLTPGRAAKPGMSPQRGDQVRLVPNPAVEGRTATVQIRPTAPFDGGTSVVDFGDGTEPVPEHDMVWNGHCGATSWDPQHVWRRPGTYHVAVKVYGCLSYGYVDNDKFETLSLDVRVVPGNPGSNGPASPFAAIPVAGSGDGPMTIHAHVDAGDSDGWITTISLDWGDGSPPAVVHESLSGCDDQGATRYPSSSIDEDVGTHRYANAGRYTLEATATSTGCDGQDAQQVVEPLPIEVPCIPNGNGSYEGATCGLHSS